MSRFLSIGLAVARRNLHNWFTNPALVVPSLLFPLFFFTAFAGGLSTIADTPRFDFPSGYTAFEFVFVLLQASAFGGVFTGFGMARDFESGFGRRMMLAAPRRGAILLGYWMAAVVRALTVQAMLFAIALAVGMQVDGGPVDLFGLIGLALIANAAAAFWAFGIALRFRSIQAGPMMQTPVFLILFLAPVYVPLDLLEGWIQGVARLNPTTLLVETGRDLISGTPGDTLLAFAVGAGLVALFVTWAVRGLRRAEASA